MENLTSTIPVDKESYDIITKRDKLDNFSNFFSNSFSDDVEVTNESITFKRIWTEPLSFEIITSGPKQSVYNEIQGPIMLEGSAIAEVMYFTKCIGNYNITKVGNTFIFENSGYAVALERTE